MTGMHSMEWHPRNGMSSVYNDSGCNTIKWWHSCRFVDGDKTLLVVTIGWLTDIFLNKRSIGVITGPWLSQALKGAFECLFWVCLRSSLGVVHCLWLVSPQHTNVSFERKKSDRALVDTKTLFPSLHSSCKYDQTVQDSTDSYYFYENDGVGATLTTAENAEYNFYHANAQVSTNWPTPLNYMIFDSSPPPSKN